MDKRTIMLISDRESIIVRSIEKKIKDMRHNVVIARAKISNIQEALDEAEMYVMYLPDDVGEDLMKCLIFLVDHAHDSGKTIMLIGDMEMRQIIMPRFQKMGDHIIWMDRPLDMEELEAEISRALKAQVAESTMKRILIVDDDPSYAKMVKEWLKDKYKVDIVTSGAQSITFLTRTPVDLILLDYEMPIVDGPQVLQMLRNESMTSRIPVIFLTGVGKKESVARVVSLKPQGYLLKTTTKEDLKNYLGDFFRSNIV